MMQHRQILIVDADIEQRQRLAGHLAADGGVRVVQAGSAGEAAALLMARDHRLDALIIEADLPDEDGRDLCARLRMRGVRIPMLVLSALDDEEDIVRGLNAGANDYVVKPYRPTELVARLRAQIRAFEVSEDAVLPIGPYQFRPAQRLLQDAAANRRIRLTEKESAVLKYLYRANGEPVARKTLLREVWGYSPGTTTHTVETHIYRLRRKIEPDAAQIRLLVNEDGGYRLDPDWRSDITWRPWVAAKPAAMGMQLG